MLSGILGIVFLATFVEGFVEYLFANVETAKPYLMYIALALGVALSVAYQIDIPSTLGLTTNYGWVNWVFSGLIIGRGSNYVNDVVSMVRK